jgi:flagellar hook-basal body complex protein FliE
MIAATKTISYRAAYERIRKGMELMAEASGDAKNAEAAKRCIEISNMLEAELDALTAERLKSSRKQYEPITDAIKRAKQILDEVSKEIADLVKTAETAVKVIEALAKIAALLAGV